MDFCTCSVFQHLNRWVKNPSSWLFFLLSQFNIYAHPNTSQYHAKRVFSLAHKQYRIWKLILRNCQHESASAILATLHKIQTTHPRGPLIPSSLSFRRSLLHSHFLLLLKPSAKPTQHSKLKSNTHGTLTSYSQHGSRKIQKWSRKLTLKINDDTRNYDKAQANRSNINQTNRKQTQTIGETIIKINKTPIPKSLVPHFIFIHSPLFYIYKVEGWL